MSDEPIRALVVEDEPVTRHLLQEILRVRGHLVEACADAETAWASYQESPPDLILLDLRLPGMDGIELCRRIRRLPRTPESVVLFVTGVEERNALEGALDAGADDYLLKPVNDQRLHVRLAIAERRIDAVRRRVATEEHLRRDALHDPVTGLSNLTFLRERIGHAARRDAREAGYLYAILYVDLCAFGELNRRVGRESADSILREVGVRLEESVRSIDTVARLGSNWFAVLLDGLHDVSDPTRVANRIHQSLSSPFLVGEERINLSACIGIALSATGHRDWEGILRDAQSALEEAKTEGPGSYRIYDPVMHAKALARIELEGRIRRALDGDEMEVHYQPIVRLEDGCVAGFEALLRWNDPQRGAIKPQDFIPVAEGSGLILALGSWVLDRAVSQLAEWSASHEDGSPYFLSVNVSGKQFLQADLSDRIGERLRRAGVDGSALHVEITETSLMERADAAERILSSLKRRSIKVQVDDFGTGYSSLSYLCRFPIDTLKIDRSFVRHMVESPENLEVVRTIIRLGKNLGMTLVAEGIETERQLAMLREMGCDLGQGFLFSRPVSADGVAHILQNPVLA